MSNLIRIALPNGEAEEVTYNNISNVQFYLNSKGCGNVLKPEVLQRNKTLKFEIPKNFPKSRKTELKNCLVGFGMLESQIVKVDNLLWSSGFGGGSLDSVEGMESKGFTGTFEEYHELVETIKMSCQALDEKMTKGKCSFAIPLRKKS